MSALRDRDVPGGRAVRHAILPTLADLAHRAVIAPAGPPLLAKLTRASILHEAMVVGSRRRAEGGDVISLTTDFLAARAELRERRRRPATAAADALSSAGGGRSEALLDDVLVALVRGHEGSPSFEMSPASSGCKAVDRRVAAHPIGPSRRE